MLDFLSDPPQPENHNTLPTLYKQTLNLISLTDKKPYSISTQFHFVHRHVIHSNRAFTNYKIALPFDFIHDGSPAKQPSRFFSALKQLHFRVFQRANNNAYIRFFFVALKLNYGRPENVYKRICVGE